MCEKRKTISLFRSVLFPLGDFYYVITSLICINTPKIYDKWSIMNIINSAEMKKKNRNEKQQTEKKKEKENFLWNWYWWFDFPVNIIVI